VGTFLITKQTERRQEAALHERSIQYKRHENTGKMYRPVRVEWMKENGQVPHDITYLKGDD
jgi:hypothetical protein